MVFLIEIKKKCTTARSVQLYWYFILTFKYTYFLTVHPHHLSCTVLEPLLKRVGYLLTTHVLRAQHMYNTIVVGSCVETHTINCRIKQRKYGINTCNVHTAMISNTTKNV